MPLISTSIPNLVNGVSQQPPSLRLSSQSEEQLNCYPSIVDGLKKRPPTEHIKKLMSEGITNAFAHVINRDLTERYVALAYSGSIKVFTVDGAEVPVVTPDGTSYLDATNPSTSFRAITIADYTFILNAEVVTAMSAATSAAAGSEALVHVRQGNYAQDYRIFIDDTEVALYATSSTDPSTIKTNQIANELLNDLNVSLPTGFTFVRQASTIHIKKTDGSPFKLRVEDSFGGQALISVKGKVQYFSDLPTVAPRDFTIEISGDPGSEFDNYYVKFVPNDTTEAFGEGVWEETIKPGTAYQFNKSTMPHALVRESDGTFTFRQADWGDRIVGDLESAPNPSFIGYKLNDIFFFRNRLGFLSDQSVVMSRASDYQELFPATVTTILDDGPIDVAAAHTKVSLLRHAIAFDEELLLFSDQTQFILQGGDILTPKTARITVSTEFESSLKAKPVGVGRHVYFTVNKGRYSGIREYFVDGDTNTNDAADITSHVPQYITGDVFKMTAASNEDIIVCASSQTPNYLYAYKFYWSKNDKLQSAWGKWQFHDTSTVLAMEFLDTDLLLVMLHGDGVYLERMSVEPGRVDEGSTYITHLDRRLTEADVVSTYDPVTYKTTFNLPFRAEGELQVVSRADGGSTIPGIYMHVVEQGADYVRVQGDQTAQSVYIGQRYVQQYDFSTQVVREQAQGGGQSSNESGRLQILSWLIKFAKTGYFRAEVTPMNRETRTYTYTGNTLGESSVKLGVVSLATGTKRFPVRSRNDRVTLSLINDSFLPANFTSAEWEAMYTIRSQRL